jgi:hypothetical protein
LPAFPHGEAVRKSEGVPPPVSLLVGVTGEEAAVGPRRLGEKPVRLGNDASEDCQGGVYLAGDTFDAELDAAAEQIRATEPWIDREDRSGSLIEFG